MNKNDIKIEKMIKKLISEEYFAGQLYFLFTLALRRNSKEDIDFKNVLLETSTDEIDDHMKNLIIAARTYGFDVPVSCPEFKIFAGKADVKAFEHIEKDCDLIYYVDQALESEKRAIASYAEALELEGIENYPNLRVVILNNYYDEVEHLETFSFSKYVNSLCSNY